MWKVFRHIAVPLAFCILFLFSDFAAAGRWAADTLSNDSAMDLLAQIVPSGGVKGIRRALDAALTATSPIDDERASRALAAAELVAAMMGNPSGNLSTPCREWATLHSKDANKDLVQAAARAVNRIIKGSETQDLMQEGSAKNLQEWQASVTDLQARLIKQ